MDKISYLRDLELKHPIVIDSDIIIIVVTLTFASTFGVYAAIRVINRHTRPPVNTLVRSGDIELDHIQSNLRDIDISSLPEYPTSQVLVNQMPIR
jgi:hypothetical protein